MLSGRTSRTTFFAHFSKSWHLTSGIVDSDHLDAHGFAFVNYGFGKDRVYRQAATTF